MQHLNRLATGGIVGGRRREGMSAEFYGPFGEVFGLGFTLEAFSFFVEAIFIAIYVYGWDRLSPWVHFLSGIPVVIAGFMGNSVKTAERGRLMTGMVPKDIYALAGAADPRLAPEGRTIAYVVWRIDRDANAYRSAIHLVPVDGSASPGD